MNFLPFLQPDDRNMLEDPLLFHFEFLLQNFADHQFDRCLGAQRNVPLHENGQALDKFIEEDGGDGALGEARLGLTQEHLNGGSQHFEITLHSSLFILQEVKVFLQLRI